MNEPAELAFQAACYEKSDINEHLPTLRRLASEVFHVTEFGCWRGYSSTAMAVGLMDTMGEGHKKLIVVDFNEGYLKDAQNKLQFAQHLDKEFILGDTREIEIEETDLLFIDSWHTYSQLTVELFKHGNKARKYLAFHDIESFGTVGEDHESPGLLDAIEEFMEDNPHWVEKERYTNNNGLLVLERV